jgi:hypothetical protein
VKHEIVEWFGWLIGGSLFLGLLFARVFIGKYAELLASVALLLLVSALLCRCYYKGFRRKLERDRRDGSPPRVDRPQKQEDKRD